MQVNETQKKYFQCFKTASPSERSVFHAKGNKKAEAVAHLKKLILTGGIFS